MPRISKLVEIANEEGRSPAAILVDALNNADTQREVADQYGVTLNHIQNLINRFGIQRPYVLPTKNAPEN